MSVPTPSEVLTEVDRSLRSHARVTLCQIVRSQGSTPGKLGWKMLVRPDGTSFGNLGGGAFEALVQRDAVALLGGREGSEVKRYYLTEDAVRGEATGMVCGGMIEVFLEVLAARPVLLVCGGGPVGQALARQAALCDFEIALAEDRAEFLRPELFPEGTHTVAVDRDYEGDFLDRWLHRELFVAVVTRCWETDLAAVAAVLRRNPEGLRYLGLMGSRRKIGRVEEELADLDLSLEGVPWRAPIGLPIGGTTPAEIAVSIAAELVRERHPEGRSDARDGGAVRLV